MGCPMERLGLPIHDTQRISPTGAAAHMSLHLNRQCQRADVYPPLDPGQSGYRSRRRKRGQATPCPAGGAPYMGGKTARQWLFSAIFSAASATGRAGGDGAREALKRIRPQRPHPGRAKISGRSRLSIPRRSGFQRFASELAAPKARRPAGRRSSRKVGPAFQPLNAGIFTGSS
jgi:hypothetical protein